MPDLSVYLTTFNCGRNLVDTSFFASTLFNALTTNLPPDLIVLSLQELAPLGYSFLGGSLLTLYFSRFGDAVRIASNDKFGDGVEFETLVVRNVGLTGIIVFARREVAEKVVWARTAGLGVGVAEMGNKGAVGVRLGLEGGEEGEEVAMTFVAAHLAPMEQAWERRNQDWRSICEGLVFENEGGSGVGGGSRKSSEEEGAPLLSTSTSQSLDDGKQVNDPSHDHTLFNPPSHLFFLGDLNYRTSDVSPADSSVSQDNWPQPTTSLEDQHHYSHLLRSDQLTREHKANRTLHNLSEAPITFPPTYKYSSAAQKHAGHTAKKQQLDDDEVWLWAKHRVPSWCDRILYLTSPSPPKIHAYDALPIQPTSDHRPVALSCSIPYAPMTGEVKAPFALTRDWRERRAAARRNELIVGMAAYLGWTWEGEALVLGTVVGVVGGWLVLRALLGAT